MKNSELSQLGVQKGLKECVIPNGGTSVSERMMATAVEALLGAVFCDGGEDALALVVGVLEVDHEYLRAETH